MQFSLSSALLQIRTRIPVKLHRVLRFSFLGSCVQAIRDHATDSNRSSRHEKGLNRKLDMHRESERRGESSSSSSKLLAHSGIKRGCELVRFSRRLEPAATYLAVSKRAISVRERDRERRKKQGEESANLANSCLYVSPLSVSRSALIRFHSPDRSHQREKVGASLFPSSSSDA